MKLSSIVLGALAVLSLGSELPAQTTAPDPANRQPQVGASVPVQTVGWRRRAYRRGWVGPYAAYRPYYGAYYRPYYGAYYGARYSNYPGGYYGYGPGVYGGYGVW